MISAIAATGDAGDVNCWSGIPCHFGQAARRHGWRAAPWRLDLRSFVGSRRRWNLAQLLQGRGPGGYQYSPAFLDRAEAAIPLELWSGRVVTFNQHFPRAQSVGQRGGRLLHYLDATFDSLCRQPGWVDRVPERVREQARGLERENFAASAGLVTMARWTAREAIQNCGVPADKVTTILPGANLDLPADYSFDPAPGSPGSERPLVLGFVGKDWKRKGLPFLLDVRAGLERMGLRAVVRCAGFCPPELQRRPGLEYTGFIDKARDPARFLAFLAGCDLGCLFSVHEPLGISTLEFLRAGVPVAGFVIEGVADTVPPDAGFRFGPDDTAEHVAEVLYTTYRDDARVAHLRLAAHVWSPLVSWERCVREWEELLVTGAVADPVQPWRGMWAGQTKSSIP